ncbi:unnamed protein product [Calypogeia fissa]
MEVVRFFFVLNLSIIFLGTIFVAECAQAGMTITTASEIFTESDDSHNLYAGGGTRKCHSDEHLEPDSTQAVSSILHNFNVDNHQYPLKIRASHRGFHCTNGFVCPGETYDAKLVKAQNKALNSKKISSILSVTLLLHRMNSVVEADHESHQLTVEAGMTLHNLADAAVRNGMSIPVGVLPVYGNLTVGGVLATSAHGTGAGVDSSLGDLVTSIKWVNAKGDIITSNIADEKGRFEIRGLLGGIGLLGIMCEVTFRFLPAGSLAQVEIWTKEDSTIAADVKHQLQAYTPHILYFWRPDLGFYRAHFYKPLEAGDVPVHPYYPRGRSAMLIPPPPSSARQYWENLAAFQADIDESGPNSDLLNAAICDMSEGLKQLPIFTDGEGAIVENATIPTTYAMISEECSPTCMFSHKYFGATTEDLEWAIRLSDLEEWVKDVKAIVKGEEEERQKQLDRRYGKGKVRACMTPGLFWLRFGKPNDNFLAISTGMDEPVVHAMMLFFTSVLVPNFPPKNDHIMQVVEQLSVCKYGARAHYGKSFDRQFTNERCPVLGNFPKENLVEMRKLQDQHDPLRVFESELLGRVLEKGGPVYEDKCVLTHKCYCKEDSHCADGFKCQPSVVFPEYRVCKVQYSNEETPAKDEL